MKDKILMQMENVESLINRLKFDNIWSGFIKTKYAIYDRNDYIINDITNLKDHLEKYGKFYIGSTSNNFIGNTAIKIDNEFVAIWSFDTINNEASKEKLTSSIVHEMFHCFQNTNNFPLAANEFIGASYPLILENIKLKYLERKILLRATLEAEKTKKIKLVSKFYRIRVEREKLIGQYITYEKGIENIEGTAVYVEYKVLCQFFGDKRENLLNFIGDFASINDLLLQPRLGSYNQGLLLCLIADDLIDNWKTKLHTKNVYISDLIFNEISIKAKESKIKCTKLESEGITNLVNIHLKSVEDIFLKFDKAKKKNKISSKIKITGFDPMNILKYNNCFMHNSFLRVEIDGEEKILKGPIKVKTNKNIMDAVELEWLINDEVAI